MRQAPTQGLGVLVTLLLVAHSVPTQAGEPRHGSRPGTFMLAEADLGYGLGEAFAEGPDGLAGHLTFGAGGKPRGWPLRFFGIARLGWAGLAGDVDSGFERSRIKRDVFSYAFGLRVIAPIVGRLRFIADTTLGGMHVESQATLGGGAERIESDDGSFLVAFGLGLQYRMHYHFSIGVRMDIAMPTGLETFDALAEVAGADSREAGVANLDWTLGATLHF